MNGFQLLKLSKAYILGAGMIYAGTDFYKSDSKKLKFIEQNYTQYKGKITDIKTEDITQNMLRAIEIKVVIQLNNLQSFQSNKYAYIKFSDYASKRASKNQNHEAINKGDIVEVLAQKQIDNIDSLPTFIELKHENNIVLPIEVSQPSLKDTSHITNFLFIMGTLFICLAIYTTIAAFRGSG